MRITALLLRDLYNGTAQSAHVQGFNLIMHNHREYIILHNHDDTWLNMKGLY